MPDEPRFNRSQFIDMLDAGRKDYVDSYYADAGPGHVPDPDPVLVLQLQDGRNLPVSSLTFAQHNGTETASHEDGVHQDDWFQAKLDPKYADFGSGPKLSSLM